MSRTLPEENSFAVKVLSAVYMGSFVEYVLEAPWGDELFMIDYSFNEPCAVGSSIQVKIDHRGVSIV